MSGTNVRVASATDSYPATGPWLAPWADLQRTQHQALLDWHRSMLVFQKDLWEQWACRYGGGVPMDG
jgi:hypothetical protein